MTGELGEMTCGELSGMAAELALGALTGRQRAEALAHLSECAACLEAVERLMAVAGQLVGLLPGCDPPPGFEAAVLARIGLATPRARPGRAGRAAWGRGWPRWARARRPGAAGT
jgi:hypothetical protein